MQKPVEVTRVSNRRQLDQFIHLPWKIYRNDPNWVPPLISDRRALLDSSRNPFISRSMAELYVAHKEKKCVGTIAVFIDRRRNEQLGLKMADFGFFEAIDDYQVADALLNTACQRAQDLGMDGIRGPSNFGSLNEPGFLIGGADCSPALLEAHTAPYYPGFMDRYGMSKEDDLIAWRVRLDKFQESLEALPEQLKRVFNSVTKRTDVDIRSVRLDDWDTELSIIHELFNETLKHLPLHVDLSFEEFRKTADRMRFLVDPELAMIAEVGGEPVGFFVAIPDINRVLIHLNGRMFPFGWLKFLYYSRRIDVISFKLLGVREAYRRRGLDVRMYLQALQNAASRGYKWLDGSLTSETNATVVRLADRLGAERYKHYRLYQKTF